MAYSPFSHWIGCVCEWVCMCVHAMKMGRAKEGAHCSYSSLNFVCKCPRTMYCVLCSLYRQTYIPIPASEQWIAPDESLTFQDMKMKNKLHTFCPPKSANRNWKCKCKWKWKWKRVKCKHTKWTMAFNIFYLYFTVLFLRQVGLVHRMRRRPNIV